MKYLQSFFLFALMAITLSSCFTDTEPVNPPIPPIEELNIPLVNRDSIYSFVEKQVAFGPRVPGTKAHKECAAWLKSKLEGYGAEVTMQEFKAKFYTGKTVDAVNIIGSINPKAKKRIMLSAHWDARFIADQDTERKTEAILGADDGGSGVAVLLEIARIIQANPIEMGVDIFFWDAEDQGKDGDGNEDVSATWCLGSQHWARNQHKPNYAAMYGILLDMVGSKDATFPKEDISMQVAPTLVNKIWKEAKSLGYDKYFQDRKIGGITDDHYFINLIAKIPTIDIINSPEGQSFGDYWHTHDDDMDVISRYTLGAVGNTVTSVVYKENKGKF
ncbi:MAG: M28 family peptidase [Saprospiraceae bacterium]